MRKQSACLDGIGAVFLVWPFRTAEAAPAVLDVSSSRCAARTFREWAVDHADDFRAQRDQR